MLVQSDFSFYTLLERIGKKKFQTYIMKLPVADILSYERLFVGGYVIACVKPYTLLVGPVIRTMENLVWILVENFLFRPCTSVSLCNCH